MTGMTTRSAHETEPRRERWTAKVGVALLAGAAVAALEAATYFPLLPNGTSIDLEVIGYLLLLWCPRALWLLLALEVAQHFAYPREANVGELSAALVAGVILGSTTTEALVVAIHEHLGMRNFRDLAGQPTHWLEGVIYEGWLTLLFGALAFAVHATQRRLRRALAALRQAELERARKEQVLAETKLAALKSRVDPDYLLNTVERLEKLYETDVSAAERLMDAFIGFLREAQAMMRAAAWMGSSREGMGKRMDATVQER